MLVRNMDTHTDRQTDSQIYSITDKVNMKMCVCFQRGSNSKERSRGLISAECSCATKSSDQVTFGFTAEVC